MEISMTLLDLVRYESVGSCRAMTVGVSRTGIRRIDQDDGFERLYSANSLL